MGTKVGKFDETVHDVLWRTIDRKGSEAGLPLGVSAVQLTNVDEVAPSVVEEARNCVERLTHAELEFTELVETGSRLPWRGVQRTDLSPVEIRTTVRLISVWEQKLADLETILCANGLRGETMTIQEVELVQLGVESIQRMSDILGCCNLASLSRKDTRDGIARAVVRARRLGEIGNEFISRFDLATDELPQADKLHALTAAAVSLGVSEQSANEARIEAQSLREQADGRDRIEDILVQLANCMEFAATTQESYKTMELAVDSACGGPMRSCCRLGRPP